MDQASLFPRLFPAQWRSFQSNIKVKGRFCKDRWILESWPTSVCVGGCWASCSPEGQWLDMVIQSYCHPWKVFIFHCCTDTSWRITTSSLQRTHLPWKEENGKAVAASGLKAVGVFHLVFDVGNGEAYERLLFPPPSSSFIVSECCTVLFCWSTTVIYNQYIIISPVVWTS